jgi:hypothetical protein
VERFLESEALSLELNKCNSYQRRLIYQTAKEKYPSLRHAQNISFLPVEFHLFYCLKYPFGMRNEAAA